MSQFNKALDQMKKMQQGLHDMQSKLADCRVEATSGGGVVTVTANGKGEIQSVKIDKSLLQADDVEMLEDLLVAALREVKKKVEEESSKAMLDLTGGMQLPPDFNLPF